MGQRGPPEVRKQMSTLDEFTKELTEMLELLKYIFKNPRHLMRSIAEVKKCSLLTVDMKRAELIFKILKSFWNKGDVPGLIECTWNFLESNRKDMVFICVSGSCHFDLSGSMENLEEQSISDGEYLSLSNHLKFIYDLRKEVGITHP